MAEATVVVPRRRAGQCLFVGKVSSRRRPVEEPEQQLKKPLKPRTILNDAIDLVRARKGRLAFGLLLMGINRAAGLILPGTAKFLLDDVIGKGNRGMLSLLVMVAGAATLVQALTSFALSQIVGKAAQRSITEMRREVQQHVGRLTVGYFEQTKAGSLLSRVMNDAEGIRNLVGTGLIEVVGGMVQAVLVLGLLLYLNVKLTLIALVVLSLFGFVMKFAFKTLRPLFRERWVINAELSGRLTESFSGVRVVKAYRAERREALVFTKGAHRLFRNVASTMTGLSAITGVSTLLLGGIGVVIMAIGASDVLAGRMTVGGFFSFTMYLGMLVGPVIQVVNIGSPITDGFARLAHIRAIPKAVPAAAGPRPRPPPAAPRCRHRARPPHTRAPPRPRPRG